ncbi:hypothetical protein H6G00_12385 [Leptolyngbya sp. FACHB-541]|uniref:hypothetical protein n=1 Tax=Leptolyngbya sp. FACHB-541 TaxID=2692810 RepID=UPI001687E578|nr:hypothetical protein [Leptolyngbya sp. FACHB-541]MBD1997413.1 hypothetical protein [Leptolyngbya sp. FACHB-541]
MKQDFRKPSAIAIAVSIPQEQREAESNQSFLVKILIPLFVAIALALNLPLSAIANPVEIAQATETETPSGTPDIDSSITREYEPAVVYIPDPQTQELVPQSVLLGADEPVEGAVDQIMQAYQGQDVGITGYEVNVDQSSQEAEINFEVDAPRGEEAFQSLSSANQYSLFEAIRETLLTEPTYNVDEVIFLANGDSFDI